MFLLISNIVFWKLYFRHMCLPLTLCTSRSADHRPFLSTVGWQVDPSRTVALFASGDADFDLLCVRGKHNFMVSLNILLTIA